MLITLWSSVPWCKYSKPSLIKAGFGNISTSKRCRTWGHIKEVQTFEKFQTWALLRCLAVNWEKMNHQILNLRNMYLMHESCPDGYHLPTCALSNLYLCIQLWQLLNSLSFNTGFSMHLIFILRDPNCWCGMESTAHWTQQKKNRSLTIHWNK